MMNTLGRHKSCKKTLIALAVSSLLLPQTLMAQEQIADEDVEKISITYRASLAAAADLKREDNKVADMITSEDIGKFPTENIAEAIQRIPGVQISNLNGRGSTISVRGLGSQFARTTLNGQTFKSADFTSGFRFDIIQSELASNISVIKSPTADMDSGGLSGTINIDTTDPLFYSERKLLVSAKGQYSELSPTGDVTPKGTVTYIDQFLDNTLGVFLNAGYQELDDRVDNMWMGRWFENDDGTVTPRRPRFRRIDRETKRNLLNGAIQWRPNDDLEVKLTGVYAKDETAQDLNQQVFLFNQDQITTVGEPINGVYNHISIDGFTLENNRQLEDKDATSKGFTLQTKYNLNDWKFSSVVNYTSGKAQHNEEAAILATVIDADLDISNKNDIIFTTSNDLADAALYPANMPRNEYPNGASRAMASDETSLQFDVEKTLGTNFFRSVAMGVKYAKETFDREVYRTDRAAIGDADPADLPLMSEYGVVVRDFLDNQMSVPHSWIAPNIQAYREALKAEGAVVPTFFAPQSSYSIDRDVFSAYLMTDFETEIGGFFVRGNIGGRYETTDRDINTYLTGDTNPDNEEIKIPIGEYTSSFDYSNFLPSANVVMELNEEMQLRFAAAKVLVRPIITSDTQLAPSETASNNSFGTTTYDISLGQTQMKAMTADQMDLGWEWYYGDGDSVTVSLFWKGIENGTVTELICPSDYDGTSLTSSGSDCVDNSGNIYDINSTYNDSSTLNIKGYELAWNQGFDEFLPIPGFGISTNYTRIIVGDSEGYTLTNSSEQTWNLTGYWEDDQFSARISLNHRSPYVQDQTDAFFAREGRVVDGRNQIDVLLGWEVNENVNLRLGALNINGQDEEAYRDENTHAWQTLSVIGRSYYVNATYSF